MGEYGRNMECDNYEIIIKIVRNFVLKLVFYDRSKLFRIQEKLKGKPG